MNTTPISPYVVETEGLTKRFGERTVVRDVELRVPRGIAFGYLGPNGAGKTTLIRMLLGLTPVTAGSMKLLGLPVPARRAEALARVGAMVEEPRFHGHLTAAKASRSSPPPAVATRSRGSTAPWSASASRPEQATASRRTRSACGSGSASRAACLQIRRC